VESAYFVPIGQAADSALLQTYVSARESTQTVDQFNCDVVVHALEYAWLDMNESASYIVHVVFPDQQSHTQLLMFGGLVYTHTYTAYYDYYITHRCLLPTLMQVCVLALALFYIHEEVVQYLMEVKMESARVSTSISSIHASSLQASADTHATTQSQSKSVSGNQPASTSTHADSQATATEHSTEKPPSMMSLYADVAVEHLMDIWNILDVIAFFGTVAGYTGLVRKMDALLPVITLSIQFR
jgi:hypothetical protein